MSDIDTSPVSDLTGRTVIDPDGDKIGTVFDVYVDNDTDQPEWLAITTGLFGTKVSFAPIAGASFAGDDLQLSYSKDLVKDAPNADADGQLAPAEEAALYDHYGRQTTPLPPPSAEAARPDPDLEADTGRDASGPVTDDAMTRSEEELDVATRSEVTGTARLRKWVETEDVHMVVPVRREKARLVTEPITDANRDAALAGGDITEEEHEVTLSEEVVDVSKHVEAKERVRLETEVETREVPVDEQVRKERIEMDQGIDPNR